MRISSVLLASLFLSTGIASAEVKIMTLRQALDLALQQSPDLMLARLDQQKAHDQVTVARDPFMPKVYAGSGAAWTSGFPASIDGAAPSILQARTQMSLFDRPQTYAIAEAKENARGAAIDIQKQQDEVAFRVASLFLDAEQAGRSLQQAQDQAQNLSRVRDLIQERVSEGRELPIEAKRAGLNLLKSKNDVQTFELNLTDAQTSLAGVLGLQPGDQVQAAQEERKPLAIPESEEKTLAGALESSPDLKRLESSMQAKMLEIKGYKAQRLPKVNLIAQYELFAKYYYQNYYTNFQRNSGQLGASIDVPVLMGHSSRAYISQAEADIAKLRIQVEQTRANIAANLRRAFADVKRADSARDLAFADLNLTREQLDLDLAQNQEGRLPMSAVEQERATENEKWLVYYDAQHTSERARLNLLRQTGTLAASLK